LCDLTNTNWNTGRQYKTSCRYCIYLRYFLCWHVRSRVFAGYLTERLFLFG